MAKGVETTDKNPEASKDFSVYDQVRVIPVENEKTLTENSETFYPSTRTKRKNLFLKMDHYRSVKKLIQNSVPVYIVKNYVPTN